ncbi:MAG: hypothetical protein AAGK37_20110 [Pseudomonadota bacterium]
MEDCLTLDESAYRSRYGRRRRLSIIDGAAIDLAEFYAAVAEPLTDYPKFRARVRGQERRGLEITSDMARQAAELDNAGWRRGWGASRLSIFSHEGVVYPTYKAFAEKHGRLDDANLIAARLKRGADPKSAIEPRIGRGGGFIYLVEQKSTGLEYVGLTTLTPDQRWRWHVRSARLGSPYGTVALVTVPPKPSDDEQLSEPTVSAA